MNRNRSEGWQHAKITGHKNEESICNLFKTDPDFTEKFLHRINCTNKKIKSVVTGGSHESNIKSITGKTTKSKTDLKIIYEDSSHTNISIKKSRGGQVYLISACNFIGYYEKQFNLTIPENVKRAINLFWANTDDASEIIDEFADRTNTRLYNMQKKHKSLNAKTLKNYNSNLYNDLLNWFKNNIENLTLFCFSRGGSNCQDEFADFVWYKNMLDEDQEPIDEIFSIKQISECSKNKNEMIKYGSKNDGTTIELPFGFVQWHQHQLQFHHSFCQIEKIIKE